MRFKAGIIGSIKKDAQKFSERLSAATKAGLIEGGVDLKNNLRADVLAAGLGQRTANTWQGPPKKYVYPKKGNSKNAAVSVISHAPHIIAGYDRGGIVRSRHGQFLCIPTENAPMARGMRKKANPRDFEEAGIKLRFIPPSPSRRVGLLVVDDFRVSDKGRVRAAGSRALRSGKGLTTVVMFILVRQISIRKRLNVERVAEDSVARLPSYIDRRMMKR